MRLTGEEIRSRRLELGWSQAALARRLGVSQVCVSRWETEKRRPREYGPILAVLKLKVAS